MSLHLDRRAGALAEQVGAYPNEQLITSAEVAAFLGIHVASLKRWRRQGIGPRETWMGLRALRFRKSDVLDWLNERYAARKAA